jgi:hypothetical protein
MSNHYPSSSGEKLARTTAKVTNMAERKSARGAARNAAGGPQGETSRFSSREARKLGRETGAKKAEGKLTSNAISLEGPRVPSSSRFLFSSLFLLPSLPPPLPHACPSRPARDSHRGKADTLPHVTLLCTKQKTTTTLPQHTAPITKLRRSSILDN